MTNKQFDVTYISPFNGREVTEVEVWGSLMFRKLGLTPRLPTLYDGVQQMSNFGKLCSALFDLFMMGICVITIMFGIMSIVYMLLHWT